MPSQSNTVNPTGSLQPITVGDVTLPPALSNTQLARLQRGGEQLFNPDGSLRAFTRNKTYRKGAQIAAAVQNFAPAIQRAIAQSTAETAPILAGANLDILKTLGPEFVNQTNALNRLGQEGQAATDLGLLQGTGRQITAETLAQQKLADPEFFRLRELLGSKADELLSGIDPNKLTEGELANVERGANRSNIGRGLAGSGSPIGAVSNALMFDDRLQKKKNTLLNTLTNIGTFAPNLRTGAFNYGAATGQAGAGQGQQQLGTFANVGQQTGASLAGGIQGTGTQLNVTRSQINADKIPGYERVLGALPDY